MAAQDKPKFNKWTTEGMSEREMISRIKSHQAMAYKAAERARANTLPDAFFRKGFENYLRDNPQSPWVGTRFDYEVKRMSALGQYKKSTDVAYAIGKKYQLHKQKKMQKRIAKLGMGY